MMRRMMQVFVLFSVLAFATSAAAHAVRATESAQGEARVLNFAYSTGEEAGYCAIEVYAPGEKGVEFQNGRTDVRGLFAFVPDRAGTWTVIMTDGMGHKAEQVVEVAELSPASASPAATPGASSSANLSQADSMWLRAGLGVSLLLNFFAGIALYRRRR